MQGHDGDGYVSVIEYMAWIAAFVMSMLNGVVLPLAMARHLSFIHKRFGSELPGSSSD